MQQRIKDGHQVDNHLGLKIKEFGDIIKNESKSFIGELGEELKEAKKVYDDKKARYEYREPIV